jgi:hypothetical protein
MLARKIKAATVTAAFAAAMLAQTGVVEAQPGRGQGFGGAAPIGGGLGGRGFAGGLGGQAFTGGGARFSGFPGGGIGGNRGVFAPSGGFGPGGGLVARPGVPGGGWQMRPGGVLATRPAVPGGGWQMRPGGGAFPRAGLGWRRPWWGHRRFGGWPLYGGGLIGAGLGWGAYGWPYYDVAYGGCFRPRLIRTYWGWVRRWVNVCDPWGYPTWGYGGWGAPGLTIGFGSGWW